MTSDRAHRTALPLSLAMEDLRANSGTQFDPDVVNVFLRLIGDREYAALLEPQLALLAERERIHLRQLAV
jgi:HD-GYP domain-containing protein (c-di-GMP phosphodiesterase class II)